MRAFPRGPTAWSRPVRLLHWLVAGCVLVNLGNATGPAHRMIGYAALALAGIRIVHGLATRRDAERLRWPGLREVKAHLSHLALRRPHSRPGHNPLGQWAVYGMWLLLALLGLTGWLSRTDAYWGEDWPVELHAGLSDALLGMAALHLAAVVGMSWRLKQDLIRPMVGAGRK